MKTDIIGSCPCCREMKQESRIVDFYVTRDDKGVFNNMYIFGDDDFDVPPRDHAVKGIFGSEDGKTITEIICPRCKEKIAVNIPVVKEPEEKFKKPDYAQLYVDMRAKERGQ